MGGAAGVSSRSRCCCRDRVELVGLGDRGGVRLGSAETTWASIAASGPVVVTVPTVQDPVAEL